MKCFIFLLGIFIGSFLNVCIYRIPIRQSIFFPPSQCPQCKNFLKPMDLIPILSYILRKGKCRYCQNSISVQYPLVELFNGILYVLIFIEYHLTIEFFKYSLFVSLLLVISCIDLKFQMIPAACNFFGLVVAGFFLFVSFQASMWLDAMIGVLLGGGILFIIALLTNGMGGGDIKLMAVLGLVFGGQKIVLLMVLSFILGAFVSLILLLMGRKKRKDWIPFAPFIAAASCFIILWESEIINWYLTIFVR
ncbi:MAG TPA: prepilin peptidase [Clostridiales bacterium]|nr:prepilin peptidase [Clostridiales bacterium]